MQVELPDSGSVLGVDVGCSPSRRTSAVCRLDWTKTDVSWRIARFRAVEAERVQVLGHLADRPLLAAAFDGPLRSDLEVIGRYRLAEQMLTRGFQPFIGKPGQSSAPIGKLLNHHANECARAILDGGRLAASAHSHPIHQFAIAEAFPSSFLGVLIDEPDRLNARRGDRSDVFFMHLGHTGGLQNLLAALLPSRTCRDSFLQVTNHDDRAALVCALTALCVAAKDYVAVGDDDGWIILPPPAHIRPWAWTILDINARGRRSGLVLGRSGVSAPIVLSA